MQPTGDPTPQARSRTSPRQAERRRPSTRDVMVIVAGLAVGLWLVLPDLRTNQPAPMGNVSDLVMIVAVAVLGGVSLAGPPLLLLGRRAPPRPVWGAGRVLWFSAGTSAWLLWPPTVVRRIGDGRFGDSETGICFAYGTPLMAVYVTAALLAGGWLRPGRRRRLRRSWQETFGLLLGLAWACTGFYILVNLYRSVWNR
jgi:hypothetical protein